MHITKVQQQDRHSHRLGRAVILSLIALLSACAAPPKPKPFTLKGEGAHTLNRDANGKSLSVVVHIYQLKDAREFSKLTFDMLASGRADSELLGASLLEKTDAVVVPGGSFVSTEKLRDETMYLGIVGYFRNPDPHHWRQLLDVQTLKKRGLGPEGAPGATFKVEDCYIKIIDVEPTLLPGQPPNPKAECGYRPGRVSQSAIESLVARAFGPQVTGTTSALNATPARQAHAYAKLHISEGQDEENDRF